MTVTTLLVLASATLALGQRPFFAGSKPIGYPEITTEALADRFGEVDGTTQKLPIEANGDRDLVDRLSKLPIDNQPFWLINWQALEANRQKPQTYPQKPNPFVDPIQSSDVFNSGNPNSNTGNLDSNTGNVDSSSGNVNSNSANLSSSSANANSAASGASAFVNSNRFGAEEYPSKNQDNKLKKAFTNANSGSGISNSSAGNSGVSSSDKKKLPSRDNKDSQVHRE